MVPNIAWVKTGDPYETIEEEILVATDEESDYSNLIDQKEDDEPVKKGVSNVGVLYTPLGMIPLNEYTDTYKLFNFWTGHCNFGVTKDIAKIIEEVPGVEVLHVFTRYRIRIAVGKMFKVREVCHEIRERIRKYFADRAGT